jgi:hypothetical protein
MARYEHLPSDDCLPMFRGKRIWELEPEWQVAYLEHTYRLDCSKHYQKKPE